jgi:hypothetical protein
VPNSQALMERWRSAQRVIKRFATRAQAINQHQPSACRGRR